jgi:hypothetical protein
MVTSTPSVQGPSHVRKHRMSRAPQRALPHWTRPLIRETRVYRTYTVLSSTRAGLLHDVDMIAETCTCESWVYQDREQYPQGHDLRPCSHILDCEDYEREHGIAQRPAGIAGLMDAFGEAR